MLQVLESPGDQARGCQAASNEEREKQVVVVEVGCCSERIIQRSGIEGG